MQRTLNDSLIYDSLNREFKKAIIDQIRAISSHLRTAGQTARFSLRTAKMQDMPAIGQTGPASEQTRAEDDQPSTYNSILIIAYAIACAANSDISPFLKQYTYFNIQTCSIKIFIKIYIVFCFHFCIKCRL